MTTSAARRLAATVLTAALGAGLLPALAAPATAAAPADGPESTFLVQTAPDALPDVLADLDEHGLELERALHGVGMVVVDGTAAEAADLAADPRVTAVTPDASVRMLGKPAEEGGDPGTAYSITRVVGARGMWTDRFGQVRWTGAGVDVAVLDTGISEVPGLDTPGKVVQGPDLSFDSQDPSTRHLDGFGHGTHMAGLIAGRDANADLGSLGDTGQFLGVAPDARLVDVKVADAYGNADVSQILAGIDWVVQNRQAGGLNVRVLNLSLGLPSGHSAVLDPLSHAAEQAWHAGIVVVTAVGNDGTGTGQLLNPARNPYLLAVGANDSRGTIPTDDDVIPPFSTRGDGTRNPDLVAPGVSVQSLRVPGSYLDQQHPEARMGERFFRGSGTSQAAALTSGAVALLLQQRPDLTPDEVKNLLRSGARSLPAADPVAQGSGMLDLRRPSDPKAKTATSPQSFPRAVGTGLLENARGGFHVETSDGIPLTGERDIFGRAFDSTVHAAGAEARSAWSGGVWNGTTWIGTGTASTGWDAITWLTGDWAGRAWAGRAWAGGTWNGRAWADGYWAGGAWAGRSWAGRAWATGGWG